MSVDRKDTIQYNPESLHVQLSGIYLKSRALIDAAIEATPKLELGKRGDIYFDFIYPPVTENDSEGVFFMHGSKWGHNRGTNVKKHPNLIRIGIHVELDDSEKKLLGNVVDDEIYLEMQEFENKDKSTMIVPLIAWRYNRLSRGGFRWQSISQFPKSVAQIAADMERFPSKVIAYKTRNKHHLFLPPEFESQEEVNLSEDLVRSHIKQEHHRLMHV